MLLFIRHYHRIVSYTKYYVYLLHKGMMKRELALVSRRTS